MLADVLTLIVCVGFLAIVFGLKVQSRTLAGIALFIALPVLLILMLTNIPIIISPFTPKVHGKVIDAETKKPLAGINIKAGWYADSVSVGGTSGEYYKIYKTKTDSEGKFVLPRGLKALTIQIPPLAPFIERTFDGVNVTVYPPGYDYKVKKFNYLNEKELTVALERIRTENEFLDNINAYWHGLYLMHKGTGDKITDPNEKVWLKYSYYQFEKLYPNSKADTDSVLRNLANILESINEPDCIYLLQKILDKYPDGNLAWEAKKNIESLNRIYK